MKKYLFGLMVVCIAGLLTDNADAKSDLFFLGCNKTMRQILLNDYVVVLPQKGSRNYSPKFDKSYKLLQIIKGESPENYKWNHETARWTVGNNPDRNSPESQLHFIFVDPCR